MLQINRVQINIETIKGTFGADHIFESKLNLIYSNENTSGKSSIISAIYYCLGFEEIIGGRGPNVLGPALKDKIKHNDSDYGVLESKILLEISNQIQTVTIFRSVKMANRDPNLITVYYSDIENIQSAKKEDMYIHLHHSATRQKGFFTFLENFIGFELPFVPTNKDVDRKLYLQLVFSSMFIEQKRGWADIFAGMPHFGIKEAKKRVIEYVLNLDTFEITKKKIKLQKEKERLQIKWENEYKYYKDKLNEFSLHIDGISKDIQLINENDLMITYADENNRMTLSEYIEKLSAEENSLVNVKKRDNKNFNALSNELKELQVTVSDAKSYINDKRLILKQENDSLENLKNSVELIEKDIVNNKDAKKLKQIGSTEDFDIFKNSCPTCGQDIEDSILISQNSSPVMSIDQNIKHLESQKKTLEFAIKQKEKNTNHISAKINEYQQLIDRSTFMANIIKNDLYALDGSYSESIALKKVLLKQKIEKLKELLKQSNDIYSKFVGLSNEWKQNLEEINHIPKNKLTERDINKLRSLRNFFVENLYNFGYKSNEDSKSITISNDTYLPLIENFDMKFDSSASDHIRGIWSFTIALLQTSQSHEGNHSNLIIFDEPGQHNIIPNDIESLFKCISKLNGQFILGITANDKNIKELITKEEKEGTNTIEIDEWAFTLLS